MKAALILLLAVTSCNAAVHVVNLRNADATLYDIDESTYLGTVSSRDGVYDFDSGLFPNQAVEFRDAGGNAFGISEVYDGEYVYLSDTSPYITKVTPMTAKLQYFTYGFVTMALWELASWGVSMLKSLRRATGEPP